MPDWPSIQNIRLLNQLQKESYTLELKKLTEKIT